MLVAAQEKRGRCDRCGKRMRPLYRSTRPQVFAQLLCAGCADEQDALWPFPTTVGDLMQRYVKAPEYHAWELLYPDELAEGTYVGWWELSVLDRLLDLAVPPVAVQQLERFWVMGEMPDHFFAPLGSVLGHEDPADPATWGPTRPDEVDWRGFALMRERFVAMLGPELMPAEVW